MEEDSLQGSVLLGCEHSSTQRRRYQLSAMFPDEPRSLGQNANEMEGKDIGLVYDPFVRAATQSCHTPAL